MSRGDEKNRVCVKYASVERNTDGTVKIQKSEREQYLSGILCPKTDIVPKTEIQENPLNTQPHLFSGAANELISTARCAQAAQNLMEAKGVIKVGILVCGPFPGVCNVAKTKNNVDMQMLQY